MNARYARPLPALLLAVFLSACGIRATEVPTEFGPAPSRMPCAATEPRAVEPPRGMPVQVFLLCARRLVSVDRAVRIPESVKDGDRRVLVAQSLLGQLVRKPSATERMSGYTTNVITGTTVTGPRKGDPADTLRLSSAPDSLPSYALAQIVCTFSDSAATEGEGSVILGGPDTAPPLRYACTPDVRALPGSHRPPSAGAGD